MASNIKVTPQELKSSAKLFKNNANSTEQMLKKLNTEVNKMRSIWEGQANKAFVSEYENLKPSLNKFVKVLGDISSNLNSVAETMERVDREIASKLRG